MMTIHLYEKNKLILSFDSERVPLKKEAIIVNKNAHYRVVSEPANIVMSAGTISIQTAVDLNVELIVKIPAPNS